MGMASATRAVAIWALALGGFAGAASGAPGDALVVTGNQVNVRSEPSTDGRIRARVDRDEPAIELGREGDWVRVELPRQDTTGWIHDSLLAVVAAGSAPAPAAVPDGQAEAPPAETPIAVATQSEAATTAAPAPTPAPKPGASDEMAAMPAEGAGESTAIEAAPAEVATATPAPEAAPTPTPEAAPTPAVEAPMPATEAPTSAVAATADPVALERFRTSVDYLNDRALAAAGIDLFGSVEQVGTGTAQIQVTDAWSMMPPSGRQSYLNILYDRWLAATGARGPLSVQIIDPSGQVADQKSGP